MKKQDRLGLKVVVASLEQWGCILKICAITLIIEVPMLQLKLLEYNLEGLQTFIMFFLDSQMFLLNAKK